MEALLAVPQSTSVQAAGIPCQHQRNVEFSEVRLAYAAWGRVQFSRHDNCHPVDSFHNRAWKSRGYPSRSITFCRRQPVALSNRAGAFSRRCAFGLETPMEIQSTFPPNQGYSRSVWKWCKENV